MFAVYVHFSNTRSGHVSNTALSIGRVFLLTVTSTRWDVADESGSLFGYFILIGCGQHCVLLNKVPCWLALISSVIFELSLVTIFRNLISGASRKQLSAWQFFNKTMLSHNGVAMHSFDRY